MLFAFFDVVPDKQNTHFQTLAGLNAPKKPKHSPRCALTTLEVKSLLSLFKLETLLGAKDYALIIVMLRLSLRVSEVCDLKFSFSTASKIKVNFL
jgi:site-specific recombinase XerC